MDSTGRSASARQVARHPAPATAAAVHILPGALGAHADLLGAVALIRDEQDHPRTPRP